MWETYVSFLMFCLFTGLLSGLLFAGSYVLAEKKSDAEKLTAYECGFDPYADARQLFDLRFYLIALFFLVFDLETLFLFPWVVSIADLTALGWWTMIDFFLELLIAYVYLWKVGVLEWVEE